MKTLYILAFFTIYSISLFSHANTPKYYSPSDDVWLNALNKLESHSNVQKIISTLGASGELTDMDEFQEVLRGQNRKVWPNKGVDLAFSKMPSKVLNAIYFYQENSRRNQATKLPFKLAFSDTAEQIRAKYKGDYMEGPKGDFIVDVLPESHPYVFMHIHMTEGKVGFAVYLYFDEYLAYMANPSPHNLEDEPYMCDAFTAIINDVDNKFFNFRGPKTDSPFPKWHSNVILDTYEVSETLVFHNFVQLEGYTGTDYDTAALAFDSLDSYFAGCIEDEDVPYTWESEGEQTENAYKITLTTTDKNIMVEHHFKQEEQKYTVDKKMEYSAYTILRFSEN